MEGGSGPESAATANPALTIVVASIRRIPIALCIEISVELKTARMKHPLKA